MKPYFLLPILLIILSCKKNKNSYLIDNTLPATDILNTLYTDTFTVFLKTQKIDSVRIYNDGFKFIGSNQDPIFGRTDAELYTHFSLPNNVSNVAFPADAVVDSAKIILVFTENFTGDTSTPQRYQCYLMSEDMNTSSIYYSTKTFSFIPTPLGDITTKPIRFNGFKTIQIPVFKGFAQSVISAPQYLINNATLQSTYKGFYITTKNTSLNPSSAQGALMKVDLSNPVSGFYVYYHTGIPPALKESKVYQFSFNNASTVRMNHFIYNYAAGAYTYLYNQLTGNMNSAKQNVFVKGLNGTRVFVDFPSIKKLSALGHFSIHRAEMIIKVDKSFVPSNGFYQPPAAMSLLALDSAGNEVFTIDQYQSNQAFLSYGGTYQSTTGEYTFNISRYIQHIISGKMKYYGMVLVATDPNITLTPRKDFFSARAVLGGYQHPSLKPVLRIYYTPIP